MQFRRRHLNATILPDGQVLVTGGTSGGGFNDLANAVHAAEVWDPNPAPGHWTTLASNSVDRVYHSVSLLLPDATVLHGGYPVRDFDDPECGDLGGAPVPHARPDAHEVTGRARVGERQQDPVRLLGLGARCHQPVPLPVANDSAA